MDRPNPILPREKYKVYTKHLEIRPKTSLQTIYMFSIKGI